MDHGGEAVRPTAAAGSTEMGMPGAVRGSAANLGSSGAFHGQLGADAAAPGSFSDFDLIAVAGRGVLPVVLVGPQFHFHLHHQPGPGGMAYTNDIGAASWRQLGPVHAVLVHRQLPGVVVVPVHGNYGYYSAPQPRPGPGARRGVVLGNLLPGGVDAGYDNYGYYALQPRPGAAHGELLDGQLPDGAGHGEAFVGLLPVPGGVGAAYDDYVYCVLQPRLGAGHGEVLPDGVRVVFGGLGDFAQQTLPAHGTGRAEGIAGALRFPDLGAGYDGSGALADDLGAVYNYNNRGMVSEHLRRFLPFVGIGASSMAINGLAAGPGSPAVAFQLFLLLLGGLFLIIVHVLLV